MESSFYSSSYSADRDLWRGSPHRQLPDISSRPPDMLARSNYGNDYSSVLPNMDIDTGHMYKDIPPLKLEKEGGSHHNISDTLLALKYANHQHTYHHNHHNHQHLSSMTPPPLPTTSTHQSTQDDMEQTNISTSSQLHHPGSSYSPGINYSLPPAMTSSYSNHHHNQDLTGSGTSPSHSSMFPSMSVNVSMSMNVHPPPAPPPMLQSPYESAPDHWNARIGGSHQSAPSGSYYPAPPPMSSDFFHHHSSHHHHPNSYPPYTPGYGSHMYDTETKFEREPYYSYKSAANDSVSRLYTLGALNQRRARVSSYEAVSGKVNLCRICGKTYARPSTLKTHMRTHSGEKPYKCQTCNKSFSQAANLTAHVRTHSGEKPFRCPICDRKFSQSSSVTTHMRTHSGERPYRCRLCKKAFSDSSTLTKHLRIHSGEKPYQCKLCLLRFSQSGNLNRHMRVHSAQQQ